MNADLSHSEVVSVELRGGFTEWWKEPARAYATRSMGKSYHRLTASQTGVYHRLLHHAWGPGLLPNDVEELAMRTDFSVSEVADALPVLLDAKLIRATEDRAFLYSPQLEAMMKENIATKQRQAEYGRQGGNKKQENRAKQEDSKPADIPF